MVYLIQGNFRTVKHATKLGLVVEKIRVPSIWAIGEVPLAIGFSDLAFLPKTSLAIWLSGMGRRFGTVVECLDRFQVVLER